MERELLTPQQARARLGEIGEKAFNRLIKDKRLKVVKMGHRIRRVTAESVQQFIDEGGLEEI